jgi:hypothetical protein
MAHGLSLELADIKAPTWRPATAASTRTKTRWQELDKKTRNKIRKARRRSQQLGE